MRNRKKGKAGDPDAGAEGEDEISPLPRKPMKSDTEEGGNSAPGMTTEDDYSEWAERSNGEGKGIPLRHRTKKTTADRNAEAGIVLEANKTWKDKLKSAAIRSASGFTMMGSFTVIVLMGHIYCAALVSFLTLGMFAEITSLKRNVEKDKHIPLFRTLRWYFFVLFEVVFIRLFLNDIIEELVVKLDHPIVYKVFVEYFWIGCYCLFILGVVLFVLSLRKFTLRYQFHQLGWTCITLFLIVLQGCAFFRLIYNGLLWFLLPSTLVISNDIFAWFCGVTMGHTRLIALSPKKTWEGFLGGAVLTMCWGMWLIEEIADKDYFLCPQPDLFQQPFEAYENLTCAPSVRTKLNETLVQFDLFGTPVTISTLRGHAAFLGLFAALIAPFGGFFASGFKRAFKIKDFGDSIPGHGGVTDRFDCHIMTAMFTFLYLQSFVVFQDSKQYSVAHMVKIIEGMSPDDRKLLLAQLAK